MIWTTLGLALREVRRNLMRSFLTTLGVVIGVGAVITMVTIGNGATAKVKGEVSALGENVLMISPGADRRSRGPSTAPPFEMSDVEAIRREVMGLRAVSGIVGSQATAINGNKNWSTSVTGADGDYLAVRGYELAQGRGFTRAEQIGGAGSCIIGQTVQKELFDGADPMGERFRVGRVSCQVVGILKSKGEAAFGGDQDDVVLMPLRTVQRRMVGSTTVGSIHVKAQPEVSTSAVKAQLEMLLKERRRIAPGAKYDFRVRDVQEIANAMSGVTAALTGLLGGIAAVSLLVGGIGIMNIMLVSVTERTREIGTRLAIGALADEVLLQFLVEAVVLSTLGGLLGVAMGLGLSFAVCTLLSLPFVISPTIVVVAVTFSAAVGVGFGYLPARKAARLNPIEALRHE